MLNYLHEIHVCKSCAEYALNGQLSDKVDVFSYGVVLLELVSGRHGLQPSRDLPISIVQWAWDMVTDGKVLSIADPALDFKFYNEDLIRMVEIALWCTQSHPHMRPSMNQVSNSTNKLSQAIFRLDDYIAFWKLNNVLVLSIM